MKSIFEMNTTICGLCLRVDETVHKIKSTHLKDFIETIINLKKYNFVPTEDYYVCYICNAFIKKTYNFVQSIWNAQGIICGILKSNDLITKPMLEHIDRHNYGLNPITLTSVITCDNEMLFDICEKGDLNTIIDIDFENKKESECTQNQKHEEVNYTNKTENHVTNEIELISTDVKESDNTYLDDVGMKDPFEDDIIAVSSEEENIMNMKQKSIKVSNTKACDVPKPKRKKKTHVLLKKKVVFRKSPSLETEDPSTSENEIQRKKKKDEDYQPDSTSHSEDSDYDSYDDKGIRIRRPKDDRVYPRQCDHCNYEVPRRYEHYRHYLFAHPDIKYPYSVEKTYACSICGKLMTNARLRTHEKAHTAQKLKCTLCLKVFPNKVRLLSHTARVHPKRTFTCDYCSKTFKTRTDIYRHLRIHTGSKPYKCHICGDGFAHSGNRLIHIRSKHQNIKYVPKKQTQKVRRNKKYKSTDTETITSDEEALRITTTKVKTKSLHKHKSQPESTKLTVKNKNTKRVSNRNRKNLKDTTKNKQKPKKKKKTRIVGTNNNSDNCNTDMNIDHGNKNGKNAETESDDEDELLITLKKKKTVNENV